ncbi:MAG: putative zinc-binding metallopeptidase [Hyphomonadaceae bacterium]
MRKRSAPPAWVRFNDEDLLKLRFRDLGVTIKGTVLETRLDALNRELAGKNILARPHAWISDEWFSPDNTPGISFPFYLAHPRLSRLERRMMHTVEGGTRTECMRILRHEAGHVVQHAYGLHRRRKWQMLFGRSSTPYPSYYRPDPRDQRYVQHLRNWYAQCHPDEDFAETFAVWLTPRSTWRKTYADWQAIEKLEYVDELMKEIAGEKPILSSRLEVDPVGKLSQTLGEHYDGKRVHYAKDGMAKFDGDLLRIFSCDRRHRTAPAASAFIRRTREEIRKSVSRRAGDCGVPVNDMIDDVIDRCRFLNLRAPGSERRLRGDLSSFLADKSIHSLYTSRRQWIAV